MEMKPGYKQTEAGVIPEDWEVCPVREIARLEVGFAFKSSWFRMHDGVPLLRGENVGYGRPDWSETKRLTQQQAASFPAYALLPGDIVIGMDRTFTKAGARISILQDADCPCLLVQRVGKFVPLKCDGQFLSAILSSTTFQKSLQAEQKGMDIPHLSRSEILRPIVPFPPTKAEQQNIAAPLIDADSLIESLEQLTAKKRHLKQGAVQELLTGEGRLPGFTTGWRETTLGDLFTFKNGLNKQKEYFGHGTPIVNYMDVYGKSALNPSSLQGRVTVNRAELENFSVKAGDVFFTRTSETVEEVGMAAVILGQPHDTVFSGFVLRGRPKDHSLSDSYKAYCFQPIEIRKQITSKASYTTRALTNGRLLSTVRIRIPGQTEQAAIAAALNEMDADIAALEAKLAKARQIKQGMMHNLLTGKIRLV